MSRLACGHMHLNQATHILCRQERAEHQASAANELLERCTALQQRQSRAGAASIVQTEETTWWMDDATLRFTMDSMRLRGQTVLTVDAEALTVSADEVSSRIQVGFSCCLARC